LLFFFYQTEPKKQEGKKKSLKCDGMNFILKTTTCLAWSVISKEGKWVTKIHYNIEMLISHNNEE